ncbi:hypothetical protein [Arthrobacter sp. H35-D1]|uniref:hypothetical protein n=1 Tax=Arthrobacter sp. H35-D1 TaxID=3046202 RepID=UPI0024B8C6F9|nr:hypothetical protein [Arthrobacter sp. H35-D1]MDJ0314575.1 hypothetical protein [Arthrobacter sp. H35-D1]
MNTGWLIFRVKPSRRRAWLLLLITVLAIAGIAIVLSLRTPAATPEVSDQTPSSAPSPSISAAAPTVAKPPATSSPPNSQIAPADEPVTLDYRELATAAARTIYTWDTRKATYSETYGRIRTWWHVLPDGSNPLAVYADQFEATGTNAAAYASLSGAHGYRSAKAENSTCDAQLAQFVQYPAPWEGLHVCTVTLAVTEHATSGTNSYTAPISVVVNCPPATTAPSDRCEMVAFYASPDRIVY